MLANHYAPLSTHLDRTIANPINHTRFTNRRGSPGSAASSADSAAESAAAETGTSG